MSTQDMLLLNDCIMHAGALYRKKLVCTQHTVGGDNPPK